MNTAHHPRTGQRRYRADPSTLSRVLNRIQPFNAQELLRLELPIRLSFEAIKTGQGTERDFHDLAAAINAAMVRSEAVDPLCEQTAVSARDALMRTWSRFEKTGRLGFDGPALSEVADGIDLHEQLIRNSTPLQMIEAMREVMRRGDHKEITA